MLYSVALYYWTIKRRFAHRAQASSYTFISTRCLVFEPMRRFLPLSLDHDINFAPINQVNIDYIRDFALIPYRSAWQPNTSSWHAMGPRFGLHVLVQRQCPSWFVLSKMRDGKRANTCSILFKIVSVKWERFVYNPQSIGNKTCFELSTQISST